MKRNANYKNLVGQQFGYLTVIREDKDNFKKDHIYWECKCTCGKRRSLQTYQLTSGKVTSCGCMNPRNLKHQSIMNRKRLYTIYSSMLQRCYSSKSISYKYYGLKGITVCDEWKNSFDAFAEWAKNNGYNDSLSIERRDNSKNYCPENCCWIPLKDQSKNKSTSVNYFHNGESHNMKEWCQILGVSYDLAKSRRKQAKKHSIEPSFEYVFAPKHSVYITK